MINPRYLIIVPDDADGMPFWRSRCREIEAGFGGRLVEQGNCLVLVEPAPIEYRVSEGTGAVLLGTIFRRHEKDALHALAPKEMSDLVATRGASLIDAFWGSYVALLSGPSGTEIVRAPFGDLPCYYLRSAGATVVASHLQLLIDATRLRPEVDWASVATYLIAPDIRHAKTCLTRVMELAGGERLTCDRQHACKRLWSPWTFVAPDRRCNEPGAAAVMLRTSIMDTVFARTRDLSSSVLLLSGGLDSSIIGAALAAAGHRTIALNMVTKHVAGDERDHARCVAEHCGMPLYEVYRDPASVDIGRSLATRLPYPSERSFTQATRSAALRLRERTGAEAVIHGGGGDHIFCSLQSAAPLADLIAAHGFGRRAVALTADIAQLAQATNGAVVRQALGRLLRRRTRYRWPVSLDFLTPDARALEAAALDHAWLDPPRGLGSGSAGHVALVLGALGIVQSAHGSPDWRAILLAQPIIEACLSIPPWLWFGRGRNRAIARNAFEFLLPDRHAWRPSKGVVDSFLIEVFEANRAQLQSMLMEGRLAAHGLIDTSAVAAAIAKPGPVRGAAWGRILLLADVEAWLASWT